MPQAENSYEIVLYDEGDVVVGRRFLGRLVPCRDDDGFPAVMNSDGMALDCHRWELLGCCSSESCLIASGEGSVERGSIILKLCGSTSCES